MLTPGTGWRAAAGSAGGLWEMSDDAQDATPHHAPHTSEEYFGTHLVRYQFWTENLNRMEWYWEVVLQSGIGPS